MRSSSRIAAAATALLLAASVSSAQGVKLEFTQGTVNLSARNATPRAILAEWARLGGTTIVGADRMPGGPITLELSGVSERQALDILLRDVPGYMLAARQDPGPGVSQFDRILVMPTTATPAPAPAPVATFSPARPAFAPANAFENDVEDEEARREELLQRQRDAAEAARRLSEQIRNGFVITPGGPVRPGQPSPSAAAEPAVRETPAPGPTPGNPFMPTPGSPTPGTIAPVPPQQSPNTPRPVQ